MSVIDISPRPKMSRRGINGGCRARGYTGRGCGRGHGQGYKYSGANSAFKKVFCVDLGNDVFNYG